MLQDVVAGEADDVERLAEFPHKRVNPFAEYTVHPAAILTSGEQQRYSAEG
jgi:hypothetical protein